MKKKTRKKLIKACSSTAAGASAGLIASEIIGGIGVGVLGAGISIGAGTFIAAGAAVGLAGYGAYEAISSLFD